MKCNPGFVCSELLSIHSAQWMCFLFSISLMPPLYPQAQNQKALLITHWALVFVYEHLPSPSHSTPCHNHPFLLPFEKFQGNLHICFSW